MEEKKWRYKVVPITNESRAANPLERQLTYLGLKDGWELVTVYHDQFILKKEAIKE